MSPNTDLCSLTKIVYLVIFYAKFLFCEFFDLKKMNHDFTVRLVFSTAVMSM